MFGSEFLPKRPYTWLAAALVGVYMVIIAGATSSIIEASAACTTWPTCTGSLFVPLDDTQQLIAWSHRALGLITGLVLLGATVVTWRTYTDWIIRSVVMFGLVLYPIQVVLGAILALSVPFAWISLLHLIIGMIIFTCLLLGLVTALSHHYKTLSIPAETPESTTQAPHASVSATNTIVSRLILTIRLYVALMKPRLMWLLCLVAAAGMALAAGSALTPRLVVTTLIGGVLAIGASGTFNHALERDLDKHMARTADRPIATHQVPVRNAFIFGIGLAIASVAIFYSINLLAAVLGLAAILYYSVIYTLVLKPNTVQNTVVGGLAGSFPALIGAAAATNTIGLPALLLAIVIFLWTPAHFYNLALAYKADYANGGIPMFPVIRGDTSTIKHIFWYLGGTFLAVAMLSLVSDLGVVYAGTAVLFGCVFLGAVIMLYRDSSRRAALRSFHASNLYLGALLVAIVIDALAV